MRQVTIRQLRANLSAELKNLPFEITKNGLVVGLCTQQQKTAKKPAKKQPTEITTKKQSTDKPKATIVTGGSFFNPCPKLGKEQK